MVTVKKESDYNKVKKEAISFIKTVGDFSTKTKSRKIAKEDRVVYVIYPILQRLCDDTAIKKLLQEKGLKCSFRGQYDNGHLTAIAMVLRRKEES